MRSVQCDKCNSHFRINLKEKKHGKGVKESYFNCTHCDKHYTAFVTDAIVRRRQRELKRLHQSIKGINDMDAYRKKQREIEQKKQRIKPLMDELKNKYGR